MAVTKRILQIIPSLDRAGAEKQFTLLATQLDRNEFDVHACVLTRGGPYEAELKEHEIAFTLIGKSWKVDPRAYWQLRVLIRRLKPDIVQTWLFAANAYGRAAARRIVFAGARNDRRGRKCKRLERDRVSDAARRQPRPPKKTNAKGLAMTAIDALMAGSSTDTTSSGAK